MKAQRTDYPGIYKVEGGYIVGTNKHGDNWDFDSWALYEGEVKEYFSANPQWVATFNTLRDAKSAAEFRIEHGLAQ